MPYYLDATERLVVSLASCGGYDAMSPNENELGLYIDKHLVNVGPIEGRYSYEEEQVHYREVPGTLILEIRGRLGSEGHYG